MRTGFRATVFSALVLGTVGGIRAEQITSTCRIAAVDIAKRTFTLVRKTEVGEKSGVAKVAEAAKITFAQKPITLESLAVPCDASVTYDSEIRALIAIDVRFSSASVGQSVAPSSAMPSANSSGANAGGVKTQGLAIRIARPFDCRVEPAKQALLKAFGGTAETEAAVAQSLDWFARHQQANGSWGLQRFQDCCKGTSCSGAGKIESDSAATALALLPFLAAGKSHKEDGPYRSTIDKGISWLLQNQTSDGALSDKSPTMMYSHGLASLALCEAYGISGDAQLRAPAQKAIDFIQSAQHPTTGGWRYKPGEAGDTSVLGWQVMALRAAEMAGLAVSPRAFEGADRWLATVSSADGSQFGYLPDNRYSPAMTAIGLLCREYTKADRYAPSMVKGIEILTANVPSNDSRNAYYWFYATQTVRNFGGPQWDKWNREMQKTLLGTQVQSGCASGSWGPNEPIKDVWGDFGGRVFMTSLSTLCLQVYYRYPPVYDLEPGPKSGK